MSAVNSNLVKIKFQRNDFLLNVDFGFNKNSYLGIYGPSGSGKSTLLRCVAGLDDVQSGDITIVGDKWLKDGKVLKATNRRKVAYVFQQSRLFPHLNVMENIDVYSRHGEKDSNVSSAPFKRDEIIAILNISNLLGRRANELSGGEVKRVAIAQALLRQPDLLMLDEPLSSLDAKSSADLLNYLENLKSEYDLPVFYVSHELSEICRLCDEVLLLKEGEINFRSPVKEALVSEKSPFVKMDIPFAILDAKVTEVDKKYACSRLKTINGNDLTILDNFQVGESVPLKIDAANVSLSLIKPVQSSILNVLEAVIDSVLVEEGGFVLLKLDVGGDYLLSKVSRLSYDELELSEGKRLYCQIKAASVHGV